MTRHKKITAAALGVLLAATSFSGTPLVAASGNSIEVVEEKTTLTSQLTGDIAVGRAQTVDGARPAEELASSAASAILIEQQTGKVLFGKETDAPREPASITKIMTMALVFEEIQAGNLTYDEMVTASENAKKMGGTQINLDVGEQMSVHDLLMSVAVASANDSCVALAEHVGNGSEEAFIERMNQKAKELGMENTVFRNTNGLPAEGHVTTAHDIALMSQYLLSFPDAAQFIGTDRHPVRSGEQEYMMRNSNALIREYQGSIGIKTGYTHAAGHCVSAAATRDNMTLIAVVLGAPESKLRFQEAAALLDHGFAQYRLFTPDVSVPRPERIPVARGLAQEVALSPPSETIPPMVIQRGEEPEVKSELKLEETLTAPVKQGLQVGSFVVRIDDTVVYEQTYVTAEAVSKRTVIGSTLLLLRGMVTL